jgi:hypothetical protein
MKRIKAIKFIPLERIVVEHPAPCAKTTQKIA